MLRTLKFTKYLPEFGWRVHVLTLRQEFYRQTDEQLLGDIPSGVTIHRTRALDTKRYLGVPDRFVGWVPFGVSAGKKIVASAGIDALFSTSPIPSAHLIAYRLKRRFHLPWVADFRDPWVEEGIWPKPGSLRYRVESALERKVILNADRVTVTTSGLKGELTRRFPEVRKDKFVVIENGFDEADFLKIGDDIRPEEERFLILHAGMVNPDYRDPFPLLECLADLAKSGKLPKEVRVRFLGGGAYVDSEAFRARVKRLAAPEIVEVERRLPYAEGLKLLLRSNALLLLQDSEDTRNLIPAKAFEYLRAGRPIITLGQEGATADLVRDTGSGLLLDPRDPEQMRRALLTLITSGDGRACAARRREAIARYERRSLTQRLAATLEAMLDRAS